MTEYTRSKEEVKLSQLHEEIITAVSDPDTLEYNKLTQIVSAKYAVALSAAEEAKLYSIIDKHLSENWSLVITKWGKAKASKLTTPIDVVDGDIIYVPPTADRIHQIVSDSIQDKGILRTSGTCTSTGDDLEDTSKDFVALGVLIGDTVLLDDTQDHTVVTAVATTVLTIKPLHHSGNGLATGCTYRVVGSGGTGSAVTHIKLGNQEDGTLLTEFVINNGTTNAPTVNSYYRIPRMHIHGSGSNKKNVGTIKATADVDGCITARVLPNHSTTEMCFIHVPMGYFLEIYTWASSIHRTGVASDAMAELEIRSQLWGTDGEILNYATGISVNAHPPIVFSDKSAAEGGTPLVITQGTDVWVRINGVSDDNTIVHSGFVCKLFKTK